MAICTRGFCCPSLLLHLFQAALFIEFSRLSRDICSHAYLAMRSFLLKCPNFELFSTLKGVLPWLRQREQGPDGEAGTFDEMIGQGESMCPILGSFGELLGARGDRWRERDTLKGILLGNGIEPKELGGEKEENIAELDRIEILLEGLRFLQEGPKVHGRGEKGSDARGDGGRGILIMDG